MVVMSDNPSNSAFAGEYKVRFKISARQRCSRESEIINKQRFS